MPVRHIALLLAGTALTAWTTAVMAQQNVPALTGVVRQRIESVAMNDAVVELHARADEIEIVARASRRAGPCRR